MREGFDLYIYDVLEKRTGGEILEHRYNSWIIVVKFLYYEKHVRE